MDEVGRTAGARDAVHAGRVRATHPGADDVVAGVGDVPAIAVGVAGARLARHGEVVFERGQAWEAGQARHGVGEEPGDQTAGAGAEHAPARPALAPAQPPQRPACAVVGQRPVGLDQAAQAHGQGPDRQARAEARGRALVVVQPQLAQKAVRPGDAAHQVDGGHIARIRQGLAHPHGADEVLVGVAHTGGRAPAVVEHARGADEPALERERVDERLERRPRRARDGGVVDRAGRRAVVAARADQCAHRQGLAIGDDQGRLLGPEPVEDAQPAVDGAHGAILHAAVERADDGRFVVRERALAQRHRMGVGTITTDAALQVRFLKGGRIGTVEEGFISRLRPGDVFLFGGRMLELLDAERAGAAVPAEIEALRPLLDLQQRWSALPGTERLLAETVRSREGVHLFFYPFAGRHAHEGLAALLAWRLSRRAKATLRTAVNDHGLDVPDGEDLRALLLPGEDLAAEVEACLNAADMARHRFREIARIAGLVFQGYPGRGKSARQLQASSSLVYDVLTRYDPDNRLLGQAAREALEQELDVDRLRAVTQSIDNAELVHTHPPRLTPLAFPLWAERSQQRVSSESWVERVQRMVERLEKAGGHRSK